MTTVALEAVSITRGETRILDEVSFDVASGEVLGLVGASGSGKTTALRAVAGLDTLSSGVVRFDGADVTSTGSAERGIAFVFQDPALYPNRTVRGNIAFPLEMRHAHIEEIRERVGAEARAAHIEQLLDDSPARLSAGEAQIVQVARALVKKPRVLLLDEPFAHLDGARADQLRRELQLIQRGFGVTTIIALNDPVEAMSMSDRLAVIERGRITQVGAPLDVYDHPRTAAAAWLTGDADVVEVRVAVDQDGSWLVRPGIRHRAWQPALRAHVGRRLQMVVRPEWWQLDPHGQISARVITAHRFGSTTSIWCRAGGEPMTVKLAGPEHRRFHEGDEITLRLDRYVLIDPRDGFELSLD